MATDRDDVDTVELDVVIVHKTERAILVDDGGTKAWLPLSQIEIVEDDGSNATILVPEWLAKDKLLI